MLFSMQLTASGLNGALFHAVLLVVKENKTGHELAPAHLPRVAGNDCVGSDMETIDCNKGTCASMFPNVEFDLAFCHR